MKQWILFTSNFEDNLTEYRHSKGMDFDMRNLKREDLEGPIEALDDLAVDAVSGKDVVKVSAEQ